MRKCGFFGLLFAASFFSLFALSSDASAWSQSQEPLPVCQNVPDFRQALKDDPRYNYDKIAYVIFERSFGGMPFNGQLGIIVDWNSTDRQPEKSSLYFKIDAYENRSLEMVGSQVSSYVLNSDGSLIDKNWPGSGFVGLNDLNCIFMTKNVGYDILGEFVSKNNWVTWGGQDYPVSQDTGDEIVEDPPCDLVDVACHVRKGFSALTSFLQGFWDSVTNGFHSTIDILNSIFNYFQNDFGTDMSSIFTSLFIPSDDNIFVQAFDNLNNYMRAKLGILLYPFDFIGTIFGSLLTTLDVLDKSEWHCNNQQSGGGFTNSICDGICAPNVLGNNSLCFKIGALEQAFPVLWQTMIWFLRIAVIGALIEMLRRKYMDITRN